MDFLLAHPSVGARLLSVAVVLHPASAAKPRTLCYRHACRGDQIPAAAVESIMQAVSPGLDVRFGLRLLASNNRVANPLSPFARVFALWVRDSGPSTGMVLKAHHELVDLLRPHASLFATEHIIESVAPLYDPYTNMALYTAMLRPTHEYIDEYDHDPPSHEYKHVTNAIAYTTTMTITAPNDTCIGVLPPLPVPLLGC